MLTIDQSVSKFWFCSSCTAAVVNTPMNEVTALNDIGAGNSPRAVAWIIQFQKNNDKIYQTTSLVHEISKSCEMGSWILESI